jgi:hypothetical protein
VDKKSLRHEIEEKMLKHKGPEKDQIEMQKWCQWWAWRNNCLNNRKRMQHLRAMQNTTCVEEVLFPKRSCPKTSHGIVKACI